MGVSFKHTEEAKRKIGLASRGNKYALGTKHTEEWREAVRARMKGRKMPPESVEKSRLAKMGKPRSPETIAKISASKKGKPSSSSTKYKKGENIGENHPRWKGGKDNTRMLYKKYRIVKLGADGFHSLGEWELLKEQYGFRCPACKKAEPEIELTEDHVIPLSRGGSDWIINIQPLCKSCNSRKHNKLIPKYEI